MTVTKYSVEELHARNKMVAEKIVKAIRHELSNLLTHPKSGVGYDYYPKSRSAVIYLEHPDLMDAMQRHGDLRDMHYFAVQSPYVKTATINEVIMPTFTDFFNGCMPSVSITVEFK